MSSTSGNAVLPSAASRRSQRPDISNGRLIASSAAVIGSIVIYFMLLPLLPASMREPGSPIVYLFSVAGTLLLLVAAAFSVVKRSGHGGSPVVWFIAHVFCANLGFVLVVMHSTGKLDRPPALLLLNLAALMALGVWARVRASRSMADTFGTKLTGFAAPDGDRRQDIQDLIDQKSALLSRLDPAAHEATFSVTLIHLLRSPRNAMRYLRLAQHEQRLIGARASVDATQAWWRPLHLALAATFIIGVLIHLVMVTIFAGYVAEGRPIIWWHLAAWDF